MCTECRGGIGVSSGPVTLAVEAQVRDTDEDLKEPPVEAISSKFFSSKYSNQKVRENNLTYFHHFSNCSPSRV